MKKKKFFGTIVLLASLLLVVTTSCEKEDDENGFGFFIPGPTRSEAVLIEPDLEYRANLSTASEEHWFRIDIDDDGIWDRLEFTITDAGENLRARLTVQDADFVELMNPTSANRGANLRANVPTQGGSHYFRVSQSFTTGEAGAYTISVSEMDMVDNYEPNDTRTAAYELGVLPYNNINATIVYSKFSYDDGYSGDMDWYSFTAEKDGDIRVEISEIDEDLRIGIYAYIHSSGTRLGNVVADNPGQTGQLTIENAQEGVEYSVGIFGARPYGSIIGTWGSYTMNIYHP